MSSAGACQPRACSNARANAPLDLSSCVHMCTSSWMSSGATSLRVHDSCQRGFGGAAGWLSALPAFAARDASLDPNTFLKKGIVQVSPRVARWCLAACAGGGAEGLDVGTQDTGGRRPPDGVGRCGGRAMRAVRCGVRAGTRDVGEPSSAAGCSAQRRLVGRGESVRTTTERLHD
jgi:hypothetical protein